MSSGLDFVVAASVRSGCSVLPVACIDSWLRYIVVVEADSKLRMM